MSSFDLIYAPPSSLFNLDGKVCLITGATGHLGRQMSAALCAAGAFVYLNARSTAQLESLETELKSFGGKCSSLPFDITDKQAVSESVEKVKQNHGYLDVLVNNAYSGKSGKFTSTSEDEFIQSCTVGLSSIAGLINAYLELLQSRAKHEELSSIINIASMYGIVSPDPEIYGDTGHDNPPSYGTMKAALIQYTRYAATNLSSKFIRVNAISPGAFPSSKVKNDMLELWEKLNQKPPLKRVGQPNELQGALIYLASNASSYVTGSNLVVDGGWTVW